MREKALAHLEMARPYTMFHAGLVAVAGALLASGGHAPAWRVALAGAVVVCGWEAGLYAGDYYDRAIDAVSKPSRPVPSGRVSPREAFSTMVGLIAAGYACALVLGPANLALTMATTALGIGYSKSFKSRALLGNFDRGVVGAAAALFGALAVGAALPPAVLLLCALVFFHDSATNLAGALRDLEGDRAAGCRTVPVVYGVPRAVEIAVLLAAAASLAGWALMASLPPAALAWILFVIAQALAAAVYGQLWRQRHRLSRAQALGAHKWLVAERLILSGAWIAAEAPAAVACSLLAGALAISIGAQALLRDRYERQAVAPGAGRQYARD